MRQGAGAVSQAIAARRSLRQFRRCPVDETIVRSLVVLACTAPAPHHSRPWRFVQVTLGESRDRLADAMSDAWRAELEREGCSPGTIAKLLARSRRQIAQAPALLLSCLSLSAARAWPDERRRLAERDMFMQSLGAALQNLLVAAGEWGLVGYLKGAPLFCPDAVRQALDLPPDWEPAFLILLGYPQEGVAPAPRPAIRLEEFLMER